MKRILIATLSLVFLSACPKSCGKKGEDAAKPADSAAAPAVDKPAEGAPASSMPADVGGSMNSEKAHYIQVMDAACAKAQQETNAMTAAMPKSADGSVDIKVMHDTLAKAKEMTDKLHAEQEKMPRPEQDSADLDKYFSTLAELTTAANAWLESMQAAADAPADQKEAAEAKVNELMQAQIAHAKDLTDAATKYGFKVCGILKMTK